MASLFICSTENPKMSTLQLLASDRSLGLLTDKVLTVDLCLFLS